MQRLCDISTATAGERTALETGALSTSILEKASINIEDAGTDERLTEHDLRSILTAFPKARIQSLLAVPVLHKRGTDQRPRCVGLMVAVNKKGKTEVRCWVIPRCTCADQRTGCRETLPVWPTVPVTERGSS